MRYKIAIITLNYNGWNDTVQLAESVFTKCSNPVLYEYDFFIVDNCSTNNSVKELTTKIEELNKRHKDSDATPKQDGGTMPFHLLETGENLGFSGGNNFGIEYAEKSNFDFYLLINNDVVVEEDFISPLVGTATKDELIGVVSPKIIEYFDRKNYILGGKISGLKCSGYHRYNSERFNKREVTFASGCCWLVKKEVFDRAGLLDSNYFLYCEDVDFCWQVRKAGFKIIPDANSIILHKESRSSPQKDVIAYYNTRNRLYFCKKNISSPLRRLAFFGYFLINRFAKIVANPQLKNYIKKGFLDFRESYYGKYMQ